MRVPEGLRLRVLLLVLLGLVPVAGLNLYTFSAHRQQQIEAAHENALRLAQLVSEEHARLIDGARQLLIALAHLPDVHQEDAPACSAFFANLLTGYSVYANLGAARADGTVFCSAQSFTGAVSVADRLYFRRALETRAFAAGEYQVGRLTNRATINFGYPVFAPTGAIHAVVFAALDLTWLNQAIAGSRLPRGSTVTVVDRAGLILARQPDSDQWVGKTTPETSVIKALGGQAEGVTEATSLDGIPRLYAFTPLGSAPAAGYVYLTVGIPKTAALAQVQALWVRSLLGLVLVALLAFGAAWVGTDLFVNRKVNALLQATRRLAAGDLSARTGLRGGSGEVEELARAFDEMAETLQRRAQEAQDAKAQIERQREALYQSEKVATLGQLLAGVAHELNNPLAVVLGRATLLEKRLADGPLEGQAQQLAEAATRCARIVKNFLALARHQPMERQQTALNRVVEDAVELLAYQLRVDGVEVQRKLDPALPVIWADPHQLHQVVVNLVSNAHQAMRTSPPPRRVTLRTRHDAPRSRVALEVADTGPGIPADIRSRIFEPFFTTKPPGQGTGLGLSLCHGTVERHGGAIRIVSEPSEGATFVVELPVDLRPSPSAVTPPRVAAPPGAVRILVVDDEPDVAGMLADLLRLDGHRVDLAANGGMALDRLRDAAYDLILTDMRMPELDGPGLYRELVRERPDLLGRIVFLTGDALSPEVVDFLDEIRAPRVHKPFTLEEVRRTIGRLVASER